MTNQQPPRLPLPRARSVISRVTQGMIQHPLAARLGWQLALLSMRPMTKLALRAASEWFLRRRREPRDAAPKSHQFLPRTRQNGASFRNPAVKSATPKGPLRWTAPNRRLSGFAIESRIVMSPSAAKSTVAHVQNRPALRTSSLGRAERPQVFSSNALLSQTLPKLRAVAPNVRASLAVLRTPPKEFAHPPRRESNPNVDHERRWRSRHAVLADEVRSLQSRVDSLSVPAKYS
jgi:hypothetical protein